MSADAAHGPLGASDFRSLVDAIAKAVAEQVQLPILIQQSRVWGYLGISRSAFFRLKGTTGFPRTVNVEGSGECFRRADLDAWASRLKGKR